MSADFNASTPGCEGCGCEGHPLGDWNLTYNLSRMLRATGHWPDGGWSEALGQQDVRQRDAVTDEIVTVDYPPVTGKRVVERFERIVAELRAEPTKYQALNPENGWGTYDLLLEVFDDFIATVTPHPDAKIGCWL